MVPGSIPGSIPRSIPGSKLSSIPARKLTEKLTTFRARFQPETELDSRSIPGSIPAPKPPLPDPETDLPGPSLGGSWGGSQGRPGTSETTPMGSYAWFQFPPILCLLKSIRMRKLVDSGGFGRNLVSAIPGPRVAPRALDALPHLGDPGPSQALPDPYPGPGTTLPGGWFQGSILARSWNHGSRPRPPRKKPVSDRPIGRNLPRNDLVRCEKGWSHFARNFDILATHTYISRRSQDPSLGGVPGVVPGVVPGTLGPWIQDPRSRSQGRS